MQHDDGTTAWPMGPSGALSRQRVGADPQQVEALAYPNPRISQMHATRMKPETHWKSVGAAVAKRGGSLADLDQVKTGKPAIDAWIIAGYEKSNRLEAGRAIRLAR